MRKGHRAKEVTGTSAGWMREQLMKGLAKEKEKEREYLKETFKFSARPRETEGGRRGTQNVPAARIFQNVLSPRWAVLDGSVVLGKLAPVPQPKEAVGEHTGDQMFSAVDGPVPCLVYLQDKAKTQSSARVEKQYPGVGLELGMKLELLLRKGLWQWEEGWGQLWGTQMAPALP